VTSSRISVLYFSNSEARAGAEEHILTLLRELDRNRFRVALVCSPECAEKLRPDLPEDVRLVPLSFENPYNAGAAVRFARVLRDLRVDILHSHLFRASLAASPVGWACGVPVILETPHVREGWRRGLVKGHYLVDRMAGRFVDHYIAVSEANARYLTQEKRLPAHKVHVIHNGSDLRKFGPERSATQAIRQSLGFAETDPVLLALGRLEPQKGHRFLLEAHARVLREFPAARLVCAGEGALRRELEEESVRLHTQKSVRFVGFQSNVADWLSMANISVLPSLFEGLPLVAIESLAAQCPMVATAVDGTTEVVVHEQTGLTVPPGDSQALAEAILRLLRDRALGQRLALAGRQWVLEHFSQEQQIEQTQKLYIRAWESSSRRGNREAAPLQPERGGGRTAAIDNPLSVRERQ
jgi:glycosyltransferase involved in cell wall biosynthesis